MADLDTSPAGYWGSFAYVNVGKVALVLGEIQETLLRRKWWSMAEKVAKTLDDLLIDLNALSSRTAAAVDIAIIEKIHHTAAPNRPQTGQMETHIHSEPGPLGLVFVASLDELEKIQNAAGPYGTFWRAQEYGTGQSGVPRQAGRRLLGTFEPSGMPPDSNQAGLGKGRDLAFFPGGRNPGQGRITVELPGRHFLRQGAEQAGEAYLAQIGRLNAKYSRRLRALTAEVERGQQRTTTIRLHF